jgi:hypothetical protein
MTAVPLRDSISEHQRRLSRRAGLVLLLSTALPPLSVTAQSRFELKGSLALAEVYDDNLFSRPFGEQEDFISRLSGRLGVGRRSSHLTLLARYGLDAESFQRHPELNTATAHQEGAADLIWAPSKRWAVAAGASYAEAQSSAELNTVTGLEAGRIQGQRLSTSASLSRRMGSLTKVTVGHSFTHEEVEGGPVTDTQAATLGIKRRLGRSDEGSLRYGAQRFAFDGEVIVSHVVTLGWSREVTPFAHFELDAGPRLTGHTVGAEVAASLKHRFQRGEAALSYLRTQSTVIGQPGPVTAEGMTASFSRHLLRSLRVGGGPSVFRVRGTGTESTIHRMNLEVDWRLTRGLSLAASHAFSLQRGGLGVELDPGTQMTHNALLIRLLAGSPAN